MIVPLFVGREKSINALEEVMRADKQILLATQKDAGDDDPSPQAIYEVGTLATVLQLLKLPDGTVKVLVEGRDRAQILRYTDRQNYFEAEARFLAETVGEQVEVEALARSVVSEFENYVKLNKKVSRRFSRPSPTSRTIRSSPTRWLRISPSAFPRSRNPGAHRSRRAPGEGAWDDGERDLRPAGGEAHPLAREAPDGEDAARIHLNEQMKAIQKELGDGEDGRDEMRELEERIAKTKFSKEAREKAETGAEEAAPDEPDVGRSHGRAQLSRLAARPAVEEALKVRNDLSFAEEVLNADHYGLEKVKERIVEYSPCRAAPTS